MAACICYLMANILLLDPNETPRRAMHGILTRGSHRLAAVDTVQEAWDFITRSVRVDLVFIELGLKEGSGLALIERLKRDSLLRLLPVVVYTGHPDRDAVKRGLELRVQNFLIKPYHDDVIFAEIAKATANPWRARHFEEEKSFCKMMGYDGPQLHKMLDDLRSALELARAPLLKTAEIRAGRQTGELLAPLAEQAEAAGAWGVVDCLKNLGDWSKSDNWTEFALGMGCLDFAGRLIVQHLNPALMPLEFLAESEQHSETEARERAVWFNAPAEHRCPVASWPQLQRELEALPGCPVIESAAASFQMAATGHPSCLNPLMDLVDKDPGLAAQMLIAANHAKHHTDNDPSAIEDPRLAVGLLGEIRLAAQAKSLVATPERLMSLPPVFNWRQFWMFQIGTARTARYACKALELPMLAGTAYTAGLLHDLGKLLLLRLHPFALQAALEHARHNAVPLPVAERLFLGCTTQEMAVHFAEKQGLARCYINVMRWIHAPADAKEALPLEETPEWGVLRQSIFPSFNLRNFELQAHAECRELKLELHGRLSNYAVA